LPAWLVLGFVLLAVVLLDWLLLDFGRLPLAAIGNPVRQPRMPSLAISWL
jgi:hypothetical protein